MFQAKRVAFSACWLAMVGLIGCESSVSSHDLPDDGDELPGVDDSSGDEESADGADDLGDDGTDEADGLIEGPDCPTSVGSQAELDSMVDCVDVQRLAITGEDITSLSPLANLRAVHGDLDIFGTKLTGLSGLEGLEQAGSVALHDMTELTSLDGLGSAAILRVSVIGAPKLADIGALAQVTSPEILLKGTAVTSVEALSGKPLERLKLLDNASLAALTGLEAFVGGPIGHLEVSGNPLPTSFPVMNKVESLSRLLIQNNAALESVASLGAAGGIEVRNALTVSDNPQLTSLPAVHGGMLTGQLAVSIVNDDALASLSGLEGLAFLDKLELRDNASLASLSALDGLASALVASELVIEQNTVLGSLAGLEKWTEARTVRIAGNAALTTLEGLAGVPGDNLLTVSNLTISDNATLATLAGLSLFPSSTFAVGELRITDNPKLPECQATKLFVGFGDDVTVSGNDAQASCE